MTSPRTDKYLRNRPFLLVDVIQRPAKGVRTEKKGWQDVTGNLVNHEQPSLVDRVSAVHLRSANVIIDVINGKIVKNSFNTPDQEVVAHYLGKYRPQVTEAMDIWLTRTAQTMAPIPAKKVDATYSLVNQE